MPRTLLIIGDYNPSWETHCLTDSAILHSLSAVNAELQVTWLPTERVDQRTLASASGLWIATGAPYRSLDGALAAIRYAREQQIPCLGTCQGFQHILLEYAQAFLGMKNPGHEEYNPSQEQPFISKLACSLKGQEAEIHIKEDTLARDIYNAAQTTEKFYCRYGVNPAFASRIDEGLLRISAIDANGEIRIVEYPQHRFFLGTLFVPQAKSLLDAPHPIIAKFLSSLIDT